MNVLLLTLDEVDRYLHHVREVDADSGVAGQAHHHAYSASEPFALDFGSSTASPSLT